MADNHERIGDGDQHVIALHGWFNNRRAFAGIWPYLDTATFSYAFIDCRGYRGARSVVGDHTMDEIAADALALADEVGWESFALVGHSMGGMAVQRVLAEVPERVTKMVGIAPVPASGVRFDDRGWALFKGAAEEAANRRAIIELTTGSRLPATWVDHMVARSFACCTKDAFADYLQAWAKTDFQDRIAGMTLPVKVIVGEHDPVITVEAMKATWMHCYPNAELEVMHNAGHYPMDETPLALVASLESFLSG